MNKPWVEAAYLVANESAQGLFDCAPALIIPSILGGPQ
jgi:hypothetical protein